jgi:Flp pilus assembly protein TadD
VIPLAAWALAAVAAGPVVVAPPEGPAAPDSAWIAVAVADALPRALIALGVPAVERDDLREAQEKLGIPMVPVTRATAIRVAESLGASRLVTGSVADKDGRVTLSLRLLDVERATLSSPLIGEGAITSLPDVVARLAWDVALAGQAPPRKSREEFLAQRPPVPFEAFEAYARGLAQSDPAVSARLLRRALGLHGAYDDARLALGRLQVRTREYATALETLARIGRDSPSSKTARFMEGVALLGLGRYAEANDLYGGLAATQASASVWNNRGVALLRLGAVAPRASAVFRQAFELERGAPDIMFNVGFALLVEGEPETAAFWLRAVSGRDAQDAHAFLVLSWALRGAGRTGEADEAWRQALALQPSYEAMPRPELQRRFERRRTSPGLAHAGDDLPEDAALARGHVARATALLADGKVDEAFAEATRAAYLDPLDPQAHLCLARIHRARGERDRALLSYRMSLFSREDAEVREEMGEAAGTPP